MGHKSTDGNKYLGDQSEFMPKEEPSLSHKAIRDWRNELREGNIRIMACKKKSKVLTWFLIWVNIEIQLVNFGAKYRHMNINEQGWLQSINSKVAEF